MYASTTFRPWTLVAAQPGVIEVLKALQGIANRIGLGRVELDGAEVVIYLEGIPCRFSGLRNAEAGLKSWAEWYDAGDMVWYEWNKKVWGERAIGVTH